MLSHKSEGRKCGQECSSPAGTTLYEPEHLHDMCGCLFFSQHLLGAGEHKGFTGLGGQCVLLKVIRAVVQGEHSLGSKEEQEKPDK